MSKKQEDWLVLKKKIKNWIKKNKVIDIFIFGSFVRAKTVPRDIDLCIIIKDSDEKKTLNLVHSLAQIEDGFKFHINAMTEKDFIIKESSLTKTLIGEGVSILKEKSVAQLFGFNAKTMFLYSLKKFSPSKRVRFHYALQGRYSAKGVLDSINGKIIGNGVIITPTKYEDLFKEFLERWGVDYKTERVLTES